MGRKLRDVTTVNQVKVKQKNADTCVYKREYKYEPVEKRNERLSSRLIGKVRKDVTEIFPTRLKKPNGIRPGNGNPVSTT